MNIKQLKKEAIKKAYGEYWGELKHFIDKDGWCKETLIQDDLGEIIKCPSCEYIFHQSKTTYCINSLERCPKCNGHVSQYEYHFKFVDAPEDAQKRFGEYRPISLQGIENNNGWIRIESEEDLPKEECTLHVYPDHDECCIYFFENKDYSINQLLKNHTHYQPIIKPQPPLY